MVPDSFLITFISNSPEITKLVIYLKNPVNSKLLTKSDRGRGVHANDDITTKKIFIRFYFLLVFGQRGSSGSLVSIPVVVSFNN